jgi:DNA-binding response OmpR family regulator
MDNSRILIVEDEPKVANFIKAGLEENSFECDIALDGLTGKKRALTEKYDAIILDINLPKINGLELCGIIRSADIKVPILMLTALGSTDNVVMGFETGADDYLVKPFEFRELVVRIRALIKRYFPGDLESNILRISNLEMNLDSKIVKRDQKKIELTAKEFNLLEFFIRNEGKVISRSVLAERIWDIKFDTGSNVIDVYINFLRKKIDRDFTPKLIHTVVGMGYILKIDN